MQLLVDNDVLIKAAHWDLLDLIPPVAGGRWATTSVLPALSFRAKRADIKLFKTPAVATKLLHYLSQCAPMPEPESQVIGSLQGVPNIDSGEILLLGALAATPDALFLTGDKRAISALSCPALAEIREQFNGRIICLEQWLWFVHEQISSEQLASRLQPYIELDTATRCIVGSCGIKSSDEIRLGLQSYIMDLESKAPALLARGFCLK